MSVGWLNAVKDGRFQQLKYLLGAGIDPNVKNHRGQNALVASLQINDDIKRYRMFTFLLHVGLLPESRDVSGRDVLMWTAILNRRNEFLRLIHEKGNNFDVTLPDYRGFTVVHYVCFANDEVMMKALLDYMNKYEIPVDIRNASGETPYALCKRLGFEGITRLLAKAGASVRIFDWNILNQTRHVVGASNNSTISRYFRNDLQEKEEVGYFKERANTLPNISTKPSKSQNSKLVSNNPLNRKQPGDSSILGLASRSPPVTRARKRQARNSTKLPVKKPNNYLPPLLTLLAIQNVDTFRPAAVAPPVPTETNERRSQSRGTDIGATSSGFQPRGSITASVMGQRRRSSSVRSIAVPSRVRRNTLSKE